MESKSAAIRVEHACKTIGEQKILRDINVEFEEGKAYGIVGRNGSGKSMLFQAICGFLALDQGRIAVRGQIVGKDVDFPRDIGFIINAPGFIENFSGVRNLEMLASLRGKTTREDIQKIMKRVGLDPANKKSVRKYSTGMRQRLALAQALMENPSILILDEPMNGIDQEGTAEILAILAEEKAKGKTILMSSHIPGDIEQLADAIYMMDQGQLRIAP